MLDGRTSVPLKLRLVTVNGKSFILNWACVDTKAFKICHEARCTIVLRYILVETEHITDEKDQSTRRRCQDDGNGGWE